MSLPYSPSATPLHPCYPTPSPLSRRSLSGALRQMATGGAQSDLARFEQQWFIANGAPPNGAALAATAQLRARRGVECTAYPASPSVHPTLCTWAGPCPAMLKKSFTLPLLLSPTLWRSRPGRPAPQPQLNERVPQRRACGHCWLKREANTPTHAARCVELPAGQHSNGNARAAPPLVRHLPPPRASDICRSRTMCVHLP